MSVSARVLVLGAGVALAACTSAPHDLPVRRPEEPAHTPAAPSPEAPAPEQAVTPPSQEPAAFLDTLGDASRSTSLGSPTNGRLEGGVALPKRGPGFRYND